MHHGAHQLVEITPIQLEAKRTRLDARHIQQVAYEAVEPISFFVDGQEQISNDKSQISNVI